MMSKNKGQIIKQSFEFAISTVKLYKYLTDSKKEFVMSKQLLRSGTAVGALARESQNAESKTDFIHKLATAQKECDETMYWLELLNETEYLTKNEFLSMTEKAMALLKMIRSAINYNNKEKLIIHNS